MAYEAYDQLEKRWKHKQSEYSYFACAENRGLRQMSERQSKQHARAARDEMSDLSRKLILHQETYDKCKGEQP